MENIFFSEKKILDIGSGSGILSVAARLLGAKEIYAVDNDYLADCLALKRFMQWIMII